MIRSSLPVILSLLGLWLILFLFFGILYVEVFSLTKWGNGENRNQNYSSLGSSLVMLAFMSAGYSLFLYHDRLFWADLSSQRGLECIYARFVRESFEWRH